MFTEDLSFFPATHFRIKDIGQSIITSALNSSWDITQKQKQKQKKKDLQETIGKTVLKNK